MIFPPLVASYFTPAGLRPFEGQPGSSSHDLKSRIEAVARAGYSGIGVDWMDLVAGIERFELVPPASAGILVDIWHFVKGHIPFGEIAAFPPGVISWVEIDDAAAKPIGSIISDLRDNCRLCGAAISILPVSWPPSRPQAVAARWVSKSFPQNCGPCHVRTLPCDRSARRANNSN